MSVHFMDEEKKHLYVGVALLIWVGLFLFITPGFYAMNSVLAVWLFSSAEDNTDLTFWVCILALNTVLSFITYATRNTAKVTLCL
jgi:hypothetical protein